MNVRNNYYSDSDKINYYSKRKNDDKLTNRQRGYAQFRLDQLQNSKENNKQKDKNHLKNTQIKVDHKISYDDIYNFDKKRKYYLNLKSKMLNDFFRSNYIGEHELVINDKKNKVKYLAQNEDVYKYLKHFIKTNKDFQKVVYYELFFDNKKNRLDDVEAKKQAMKSLKTELNVIDVHDMELEDIRKILEG
ncbi:hypothetical protein KHQ81_10890 [Mycoplasmatota bacterium]|nr:hypothetical protein KHQ81_10890 [Mycoplasmatota bacterium]